MPQRNGKNPIRAARVFGQSFNSSNENLNYHKAGAGAGGVCPHCKTEIQPRPGFRFSALKCPKCGKAVTVGVMNRVEQLADRPEGFQPANAIPYKNLIPFDEIIAEARGVKSGSVAVERDYRSFVAKFGTEFNILLGLSDEELLKGLPSRVAEGVLRVRKGSVDIKAGYDGEYGIISIFGDEDKGKEGEKQLSLF